MQCRGQALSHHAALPIADRGRVIERVAHDRAVGAAHQYERHLVGNRVEPVLDHLEGDRVDIVPHVTSSAERRMLPPPSRLATQPGGTRQVASYSSMIAGPARGVT